MNKSEFLTKGTEKKEKKKEPCWLARTEQEGILHGHACIRWTTIAWAHQIWWREIENSRKVTVLLKAIS